MTTLRIAHISDTHDAPRIVRQVADLQVDVICLTGDILNNRGRINGGGIIPSLERKYQESWGRKQAKKWAADFGDTPVVYVDGNHDFIDIGKWLRHYGCTNLHHITAETPCVEVNGVRFAGFREIPWIAGEWEGEVHDLRPAVDRAFECNPDILVTHGPPAGILDGPNGYGSAPLATALTWRAGNIKAHLFGHVHETGGTIIEEMGITFSNAANHCQVVTVNL